MGRSHAHAVDNDVLMQSNIFASPSSLSVRLPDTPDAFSAPMSEPRCACFFYKGVSCNVCAPKSAQKPVPSSSSSTQGFPPPNPAAGSNPGQMPLVEKNVPVKERNQSKQHPLRIRIPRRGASSRAADSQTIQVLPKPSASSSASSDNVWVKVEDPAPGSLLFLSAPLRDPQQIPIHPNVIRIPDHDQGDYRHHPVDERIPSSLPPEVQIIIDAYISGTPLNVVASRSVLKARWGVSVPDEYAYAYMGFFMVAEVLVRSFFLSLS